MAETTLAHGGSTDTGWQPVTLTLSLDAGVHTLTVGGYNNKKTRPNEVTQIFFDDVSILLLP